MKIISTLLLLLLSFAALAQPQKLNYQAVARNAAGAVIANKNISVKAEIVDSSQSTVFYAETHSPTTNQFGLFTLQIGGGTVLSGSFAGINWGSGDKFLTISLDTTGG